MRTYQTQFPRAFTPPRPLLEAFKRLGFEDRAYGNDVCPRFDHDGGTNTMRAPMTVWCNEKSAAAREMGGDRYAVCRTVSRPGLLSEELVDVARFERTADLIAYLEKSDAERLADRFRAVIRKWLPAKHRATIDERNATYHDQGLSHCATHEFCDSNEAMLEAYKAEFAYAMDVSDEGTLALVNAAWKRAVEQGFADRPAGWDAI